jgi:hypothetical protein
MGVKLTLQEKHRLRALSRIFGHNGEIDKKNGGSSILGFIIYILHHSN